jgi:hypothetical protein
MSRYNRETGGVGIFALYRSALRHTRERVVSARAVRAESAFVIRAQARHLLLPTAHVRDQRISLITRRRCNLGLLHKTAHQY